MLIAAILKLEGPYNPGLTRHDIPVDAVTTSGSGIDPDISPANAQLQSRLYWSGGLVLGGAVLGIASSAYSANPVSRDQLMGLIRQHNNQILGKPGVQVGAMALPGGGGLTLAGNF